VQDAATEEEEAIVVVGVKVCSCSFENNVGLLVAVVVGDKMVGTLGRKPVVVVLTGLGAGDCASDKIVPVVGENDDVVC